MITKQQWRSALPSDMRGMRIVATPTEELQMQHLLSEHNRVTINRISNSSHPYYCMTDEDALAENRQERVALRKRVHDKAPAGISN